MLATRDSSTYGCAIMSGCGHTLYFQGQTILSQKVEGVATNRIGVVSYTWLSLLALKTNWS